MTCSCFLLGWVSDGKFLLIISWLTSVMFSMYTGTLHPLLPHFPFPKETLILCQKSRHNCYQGFTNSDPIAFVAWKILVIHSNKHRLQLRDIMSNSKASYKTFPIHITWQTLYAKGGHFHTRYFYFLKKNSPSMSHKGPQKLFCVGFAQRGS